MKIIVTGATSMIGAALVKVALSYDAEIYAVVRPGSNRIDRLPKSKYIHVVECEINNYISIKEIPNDCDCLYHLAWSGTNKVERDDPVIQERNIRYALDAVELAEKCGCKRFVGAGSQAEYGSADDIIDMNTKYSPVLSYGAAKYAAYILSEKMCKQKGLSFRWGRIFSVYGPNDNEGTMLNVTIDHFISGKTAYLSSATQMWNYLYESDAGEMFYRLGLEETGDGVCFVANSESKPLKEYVHEMILVYGRGAKVSFAPIGNQKMPGLNVNMEESLTNLRYVPQIGFREGISRVIEQRRILAHMKD